MKNDIESRYKGKITSKTNSTIGITSMSRLDIHSKTMLELLSVARNAEGADIIAMAGIFGNGKVAGTTDICTEYIKKKHL